MVHFDYIVVGAGVEGSATAYQLTLRGHNVLLLEQFALPHTRGSSHGSTRITRKAYDEPIYAEMMQSAYKEWEKLERMEKRQLFVKTGGLCVASPKIIEKLQSLGHQFNNSFESLSAEQINERYNGLLSFQHPDTGMIDKDAGVLKADKCLQAFWNQIKQFGGSIYDEEEVLEVIPGPSRQRILTSKESYTCKKVILCLGAWSGGFAKSLGLNLPLKPELIKVCYWEAKQPGSFGLGKFPPLMCYEKETLNHFYGLPALENNGLFKFCLHAGPAIQPHQRDVPNADFCVENAKRFVGKHIPGLKPEPSIIETCIYTWTPDAHFILDNHPNFPGIVIGAGFSGKWLYIDRRPIGLSLHVMYKRGVLVHCRRANKRGHGFKLSVEVGNVLADLATNASLKYNMESFRIGRFQTSTTSSRL